MLPSSINFAPSTSEIDIQRTSNGRSKITFRNTDALTIRTDNPFVRDASCGYTTFSVYLPKKPCKTAIGFSFCQNSAECHKYMTPAYSSGGLYVSFGGAGFIYPSQERAVRGYGEGDTVRASCDFSSNVVNFFVNGASVAAAPLDTAACLVYPSISCERGVAVIETWFE